MASNFIWYELMTPDQDAAIDFYTKVVGWTAAPHPGAEAAGGRYMVLSTDGVGVGGVFEFTEEMKAGGKPPMWVGYIWVADADEAAERIAAAGGSIHKGPDDIPGVGRFAMVADPGGAPFYILAPLPREDEAPRLEKYATGTAGWHELYAGQGEKAAFDFYSALFGWETLSQMDMGPMGSYRIFGVDGERIGGMMDKPPQLRNAAWGFYFTTPSIDAAAERVTANGGTIRMGPMEVPDGSWVIQCADPQGGVFSMVSRQR